MDIPGPEGLQARWDTGKILRGFRQPLGISSGYSRESGPAVGKKDNPPSVYSASREFMTVRSRSGIPYSAIS